MCVQLSGISSHLLYCRCIPLHSQQIGYVCQYPQGAYVPQVYTNVPLGFKGVQVQNTKKLQWQLLSILSSDIFGQKILLLLNFCRKQALISIENGVQCRNAILQSYIIIKQMEQFPILPGILYLQELLCVQIHSIQGEL